MAAPCPQISSAGSIKTVGSSRNQPGEATNPTLQGAEPSARVRGEHLRKLLGFFFRESCLFSPIFIFHQFFTSISESIMYLYQCGLTGIYFTLWGLMQYPDGRRGARRRCPVTSLPGLGNRLVRGVCDGAEWPPGGTRASPCGRCGAWMVCRCRSRSGGSAGVIRTTES